MLMNRKHQKKNSRIIACILFFATIFTILAIDVQAEELSVYARSALLMDASSGRVLYEENGYRVMPMASTTKIMTCILALEWMELQEGEEDNQTVTISAYAARMPKVHLGMKKGEEYLLKDLLYSLMLESHNDTAVAIAEHIDGNVEVFAKRMNNKAKELGCKQTNFITPNGLDDQENGKSHSTTAYDLALIASYAMRNDAFKEIINTRQYAFSELKTGRGFQIANKNRFLDMMDGAVGIKTGFTGEAGYCFVGAIEKDEKRLISVVLGSGWPPNKNWKWSDTKTLMTYGINMFESKDLEKKLKYEPVRILDGVKDEITLCVEKKEAGDLTVLLSETDEVCVKKEFLREITAPIKKDTVVGYECYYINGELFKKYEIRTAESVQLRTYFYCLRQIFMLYF